MLQSVGWADLLVRDRQESGFWIGAERTFSGNEPCAVCKTVGQAKQAQPKHDAPAMVMAKDLGVFLLPPEAKAFELVGRLTPWPNARITWSTRRERVPVPPPRVDAV